MILQKLKYLIAFIGIISVFLVGCSAPSENDEQNIEVQKLMDNDYQAFKEITHKKKVQKVKEIIRDIPWEKGKVNMARPADYRFGFQYKNPGITAKAVLYELWISPNKDKVELVIDAESKYIQLDKNKSAELFELLTGEKLSDVE